METQGAGYKRTKKLFQPRRSTLRWGRPGWAGENIKKPHRVEEKNLRLKRKEKLHDVLERRNLSNVITEKTVTRRIWLKGGGGRCVF